MGARISPEMLKARKLIEGGMSPYEAAKRTGISRGAISKSAWYKARKAEKSTDGKGK